MHINDAETRGLIDGLKPPSILNFGMHETIEWGVTNHWTELDWTGLDWTHSKFLFRPFQRRTEAKHAYSLMHSL